MILDVSTKIFLKKLCDVKAEKWWIKNKINELLNHDNDIFFLVKVKRDGMTDNWEIYQIVSDEKEKVIDFLDKNYDEYEFIFTCTINKKVYRVK